MCVHPWPALESLFVERMKLNEELFTDSGKPELQELVAKWLGRRVYDRLTSGKPRWAADFDAGGDGRAIS